MKKKLLLFTEQFPFGQSSETSFLQHEGRYLNERFDVTIVPYGLQPGVKAIPGFDTDTSLAAVLAKKSVLKSIFHTLSSRFFYRELLSRNVLFWDIRKLKRFASYISRAVLVKKWFMKKGSYGKSASKILLYTYWNNEITLGLGDAINGNSLYKLITRAHGHDLYENKSFYGYIPCLKYSLELVEKFYTVSNDGQNYINNRLPGHENKVLTKYLGVFESTVTSNFSYDGILRIVSCSYLKKPKRVDRIIEGIAAFITKYPNKVKWTHFGDGPEEKSINSLAATYKSDSFEYDLKGFVPNKSVLKYYRENPVDLFITTSETEGLPVTLQEAQAHGIPVIGTAVNGIPEIINEKVGVLLSENPGPDEIAEAIHYVISDRYRFLEMKKNSVENWSRYFNAQENYKNFAEELLSIANDNLK